MKILSSFTLPQVDPNLYEFLSSVEHKRREFEECWELPVAIDFHNTVRNINIYIYIYNNIFGAT